ncbi:MAG: hydrogen gas-evolving membrane-bound hydrogenase subunit E [Actinomycetota bacterium]
MIWLLLVAHLAALPATVIAGKQSMRSGLAAAAVVPAITAVWAAVLLIDDRTPTTAELVWVDGLDLALRFRTDAVALMMTLLVSGIGALVFVYAIGYFSPGAKGGTRFPASLLAFSASMLGLVLADSVWTLFIFWELTSITSFLLVGHKNDDESVLAAARRALMITGAGGLVLLAGLLILADEAGTVVLSELTPVQGGGATLAAILILIGAATKSAQVPFHVWLPGAMAAPTPVSAYLHSATMVKAGVLLVAVLGSTFAEVDAWKVVGLGFGIISMLWGAVGALRHRDAKLILAWGTVSQLGLLITLLSVGSGKATFAATSILFAHALFKAALFLTVGEIDIRTGTRDIGELGGLARKMPITFAVALAGGLSMAGVPPLLGFAAKEAAIEAVLGLEGPEAGIAGFGVIGGSILTVAYTTRFLVTVFGPGPDTTVAPRRWAMTGPAVFLGSAGVVGYAAIGPVNDLIVSAATELNEKSNVYLLFRWPGLTTGLAVSAAVVGVGALLGAMMARRTKPAPKPTGATLADDGLDGVLKLARNLTAIVQHGSLPVYLATMGATATIAAIPFLFGLGTDHLILADDPVQALLAVAIVGAAAAGMFVRSRLGAALTLGAVGLGVSGMFVVHGAPDLVLTQLLVETVVVVGFVIGLGHLDRRFPRSPNTWRAVRITIAMTGGIAVMLALAAAGAGPVGEAPVADIAASSVDEGGGNNIVNVVLTDLRALDTLGEVVVLATAAVGILALARAGRPETEEAPA